MSVTFKFESDTLELANLIADISKKTMPSEAAKALNRAVTYVKNEVAAEVSARTGIKQNLVKRRIKQIKNRRASPKKLITVGFVGEATIPVSKVTPRPKKSGSGVIYKTISGMGHDPKAFFAKMGSGQKSAFVRKSGSRLPIVEKQINIGPVLRRATRRIMRNPAHRFFEETFFDNMEKRINKDIAKRGLTHR